MSTAAALPPVAAPLAVADGPLDTSAPTAPAAWQTLAAAKKTQQEASIPNEWRIPAPLLATVDLSLDSPQALDHAPLLRATGILSAHELELTEAYSATELQSKLAAGELSAFEVTQAFCKRAAIAQQLLHCLTEMFFDRALARARDLDAYRTREGKVVGPLHGLPVSLKDTFNITGIPSSIGYVSFLGRPLPTSNSALVDLLLDMGAVLYVKTNIPQTMMTADSENNIFGRTRNPRKLNLTAGGSSGGEGALLAFRGSVLGVGTDVAGSIRIPSLCCGTYGFKPTSGRVPFSGQTSTSLPGLPGLQSCAGPMATTLADLSLLFTAVLGARPWTHDAQAMPVPFQTSAAAAFDAKPVLRIGLLPVDPAEPLHPPVKRALANAVAALVAAGHTVVPVALGPYTSVDAAAKAAFGFFAIDPTHTSMRNIQASGEPMIKTVAEKPSKAAASILERTYDVADVAALHDQRMRFQDAWRALFEENALDAVIGPGAQHTATKHDTYGMPSYTVIWNLVDFPACIIPYGTASKTLDPTESAPEGINNPKYDAETFDGAPTAVQVVTPRFRDEECLAAAARIDAVLNGSS